MQHTLRPYTTAGIAIVGASLIAVTPVAAPLPGISPVRDVALTAGEGLPDLLAPWTDVWNTASANATQLANNFFLAPGVGFQQFLVNQADFLQQVLDDPSTIPDVMNEMQEHLRAVTTGYTLQGAPDDVVATVTNQTLSQSDLATGVFGHDLIFQLLPQFLPADQAETLTPIINFLASPASAILIGALGPSISPWVALGNSITDGDSFSETITNMVGAYYNGATLDLDSLLPLIAQTGLLPEGTDITHLDFAFGGLLSGGDVSAGPWEVADGSGNILNTIPAVGGSIFNSLGLSMSTNIIPGLSIDIDSEAIGPIGAWEAWSQIVGSLLGSGWDGKDPIVVTPPGAGLDFPIIPGGLFDDGGAGDVAAEAANAAAGVDSLPDTLAGLAEILGF